LIGFGAALMKDGIGRCLNRLEEWRVHSLEKDISRRDAKAQSKSEEEKRKR
jgi:hypothetical protein